jgi:iron complex outermembrane recepter protein
MTKTFVFFCVLLVSTTLLFGQPARTGGSIKGTVITSDGKPAPFVSVRILRSTWGGTSNEKGEYLIKNVKPGNWVVEVTAIDAATQQREIVVAAQQTVQVDFTLKENAAELQEVSVSAKNLNSENNFVAKMPLKKLENPQVYNTVSLELMKQQGITNYDDALRNVPGITRTWESTGRAGDGAAYFALRGFDAQPVLYNGLPGLTSGNLDPANTEEIVVIKGPSGTMFGGSFYSYGGMINTITKKPYFHTGGEISYSFGSFGLNRLTGDINAVLSKKDKIALRVNTAYHSENSFQDAGFKKSFFIAPSLAYEVNDKLSFQVIAEILDEERAVPPVFFHSNRADPLPFKTIGELNLNNDLSFTSNDLTIKNPRYTLQAQMLYKLNDHWTSQTVVSRGTVKSNGHYTYIWDDVSGDNLFSQYFHKEQQTTSTTDIQQNFNGDFHIGSLRNRLLVGLDYYNRNIIDNGTGWSFGRNVTPQGDVSFTDPFTGDELEPVYLTSASVDNLLAGSGISNSNIRNSSYSAYVSDVLNIGSRVMAMMSVRADYFDSKGEKSSREDDFDQWAVSPKFGLVYQPVLDKLSIFASYMNGFINVAPRQVTDANGSNPRVKSFSPEHANQFEGGVKANLFGGKMFATVSAYDIQVSNRVTVDPANINNYLQGGEVESKGFEIDITANPVRELSLIAGYSFNEIKVVKGNENDFYAERGRSPGGQGPQNLANLWANYKISSGRLKNFGIGLGGNYGSRYKVIDNSKTGNFYLPSYVLLNASLFYNAEKFRATFNLNNLANEVYYIGYWSVNPQRPRNFVMSVAYKF